MAVLSANHEVKVRVPAKRMFKAVVVDSNKILPKIAPRAIKSIDILQGDGGAGSIRQINFPNGAPFPYVREKIDILDMDNLVFKARAFESRMFGDKIEAIHSVQKFEDSGDGGCIIKLTVETRTKDDAEFTDEESKVVSAFGREIFSIVEEYLIAHPDVCA
ncbi:pathogenesis-related protein STH-21-like [Dorcoceras hygrometricum]|uniref:Pathogenesis-related protein STH-21-like n=1 Tax=Dorcoceras hygrometricum TaxID=472368 RepID=A0A2Z7AGN9_9LAMI|nr:pathogenesis-related protein STH-21-like [Dorcoceras hygrometricum]